MRYLHQKEKWKTKELWQKTLPELSPDFLDYYYSEKIKDNQILVQDKDGQIVSMIHRNPKMVYLKSAWTRSELLTGIATREEYRRRGIMRKLLIQNLVDAQKEQIPFQFLVPFDPAIYEPLGFRYMSTKPIRQYAWWDHLGLIEKTADQDMDAELASFVNICLSRDGGLFVQRTPEYFSNLRKERQAEGGGVSVLYDENGLMTGYYNYLTHDGEKEVVESVFLPTFRDRHVNLNDPRKPHVMARITSLTTFLRCFTIPQNILKEYLEDENEKKKKGEVREDYRAVLGTGSEEIQVFLDVADPVLPANHGHFIWGFRESRSHLVPIDETRREVLEKIGYDKDVAVVIDIADLGSWLYGYRTLDELIEEGLVRGPEEALDILRKVKPLRHIFLREEI